MPDDVKPTVQIMVSKLDREIARLRTAKQLEDATDHATNGAVTAWQLADWVWKLHLKDSPKARSRLNLSPCGHIKELERDFKKKAASESPELQLCADIAARFKHVAARPTSTQHPRASGPAGSRAEQEIRQYGGTPDAPVHTVTIRCYEAFVTDERGTEHDMAEVLGACRTFWLERIKLLSP